MALGAMAKRRAIIITTLTSLVGAIFLAIALPSDFYYVTQASGPWLLRHLATSESPIFWWVAIYDHDFLVALLLCLPLALLLVIVCRATVWYATWLAVVASVLWSYRLPLFEPDFTFFTSLPAAWGFVEGLLLLPIAVLVARRFRVCADGA